MFNDLLKPKLKIHLTAKLKTLILTSTFYFYYKLEKQNDIFMSTL